MKIGGKEDGDKLVAQLTGEIILEKIDLLLLTSQLQHSLYVRRGFV